MLEALAKVTSSLRRSVMFIAKSPPKPRSGGVPCNPSITSEHQPNAASYIALLRSARWRVSSAIKIKLLRSEEVTFARASLACRETDQRGPLEFTGLLLGITTS